MQGQLNPEKLILICQKPVIQKKFCKIWSLVILWMKLGRIKQAMKKVSNLSLLNVI